MDDDHEMQEYQRRIASKLKTELLELQTEGWLELCEQDVRLFSHKDASKAVRLLLHLETISRLAALLHLDEELEINEYNGGKAFSFIWSLVDQLQHLSLGVDAPGFTLPRFGRQKRTVALPVVTDLAIEITGTYRALAAAGANDSTAFEKIKMVLDEFHIKGHKVSTIRNRCMAYKNTEYLGSHVECELQYFYKAPNNEKTVIKVFRKTIAELIMPKLPDSMKTNA